MEKKLFFVLLLGMLSFQGCKKIDCTGYDCFTPPEPFIFELLDKNTKENLFSNGTLDSTQIEVLDTLTNNSVDFKFLTEDSINVVVIYGIGWQLDRKAVDVVLRVSGTDIVNVYVDSETLSEECCTFVKYYEVKIGNANYTQDKDSGWYQVLVN